MAKRVHRAGRRRVHALRPRDPGPLLERILETPNLARVVPRLQPELLHRVIQRCGLEDCWELVALATPDQLARVIDLDLWRADRPGADEQFDAARFGVWVEVLMESGPAVAAQKLAQMDVGLVSAGFAQHARVFDRAAVSPPASMAEEGEEHTSSSRDDELSSEVGGYVLVARRADAWDAVVSALLALDAGHHDYFHRLMRACRSLSNAGFELDGLDELLPEDEQVMFDLALDRERRREAQGYTTPAQARAFLQMARRLPLQQETPPSGNPIARAYFRSVESANAADPNSGSHRLPAPPDEPSTPQDSADEVAALIDVLASINDDAGVLAPQPRALLEGPRDHAPRLARIHAHMHDAAGAPNVYSTKSQELAYLANTIVAGCSIQARPFTAQEASDAAIAICNLGLENWPRHWPADNLVSVFQVGWTVLHDDVVMDTAERLIRILTELRCADLEIQIGLDDLRFQLTRYWRAGTPWRARDAFDVIAILDMPTWAALLGLIDECPVIHAGLAASRDARTRSVSASAFEFISENNQIASVRDFMQSLPDTLRR